MSGKANPKVLEALMHEVDAALQNTTHRPVIIGVCGSQASGKTTLCAAAVVACEARGLRAAMLSIDDIYLTRAEREELGRTVHPLFVTRGPPGTHDIALANDLFTRLRSGEAVALPRFDKPRDDRAPPERWEPTPSQCEVLFFEGWCIGARPQEEGELGASVNELEAHEDPEGIWRLNANTALAGPYRQMFAWLDSLVLLAAPSFDVVHGWRVEQEEGLRRSSVADANARFMDGAAIRRFISHYERLTRHILDEMPRRADLLVRLDRQRTPLEIARKSD